MNTFINDFIKGVSPKFQVCLLVFFIFVLIFIHCWLFLGRILFLGSITQERVRQSPDGLEIIKDERKFEQRVA